MYGPTVEDAHAALNSRQDYSVESVHQQISMFLCYRRAASAPKKFRPDGGTVCLKQRSQVLTGPVDETTGKEHADR